MWNPLYLGYSYAPSDEPVSIVIPGPADILIMFYVVATITQVVEPPLVKVAQFKPMTLNYNIIVFSHFHD